MNEANYSNKHACIMYFNDHNFKNSTNQILKIYKDSRFFDAQYTMSVASCNMFYDINNKQEICFIDEWFVKVNFSRDDLIYIQDIENSENKYLKCEDKEIYFLNQFSSGRVIQVVNECAIFLTLEEADYLINAIKLIIESVS